LRGFDSASRPLIEMVAFVDGDFERGHGVPPGGVLLRPVPRRRRQFLCLPFESIVEREHPGKLDFLNAVLRVTLVSFGSFVGVVVTKDSASTDFPEMQTVVPSTWVLFVCRLPDGDINDVAAFDVVPIFDRGVGRHPSSYGVSPIAINLWTSLHSKSDRLKDLEERRRPTLLNTCTIICVWSMGTQTISLADGAYERLKAEKREGESFIEVVGRLTP
jgi:hypothetical protein